MPALKVMHVVSGDLWGGAEAQVHTLCKYLKRSPEVEIEVIIMNAGELKDKLDDEGIKTHLLDERSLNAFSIFASMRKLFQTFKPHVVHTHREKENILASLANSLSIRARCVRTQHGAPEFEYTFRQFHKKLQQAVDLFCGRYLQDHVIAVSAELASKLKRQYRNEHIVVIENGVDIERYLCSQPPAQFRQKKPGAKHIGIVGRLVPVKRVDIFLDMAQILLESPAGKQEDLMFHIIGDGPLRSQLEAQAKELKIEEKVCFHGHTQEVASLMASLDVLVMCSDHEGLPMTLLEAMVLKVPVVGHHVGAMKAPFARQEGGILSSEHTAASYAEALKHVISDVVGVSVTDKGFNRVQETYSANGNALKVSELYSELIKNIKNSVH